MNQPNTDHRRAGNLFLMLAGFAAAALLTLGAAIGTSMWQQDARAREFSPDAPVVQR